MNSGPLELSFAMASKIQTAVYVMPELQDEPGKLELFFVYCAF